MLVETVVLLVLLLAVAAFVKGGFAFTIIYLFLGITIVNLFWTRQSAKNLTCERKFEKRVFWGEKVTVRLEIRNKGWLPIPWLLVYESLPVELAAGSSIKRVLSLGPHGRAEVVYKLEAYKRGFYPVGPFTTKLGDTLGLADIQELEQQSETITVYPHIVPLTDARLPSRSPLGTLRHHQPIFEDPSRVRGKRDYTASDSLRQVDWKATASTGRLQVKQYEPSIALQTVIFLNLNASEYAAKQQIDATELAIIITASLANWAVTQKQAIGLTTNGVDSRANNGKVQPIASRKGRGQLVHILDLLAGIQTSNTCPLTQMLSQETPRLPWGTTVVIITGAINEALFDEIFQIQRRGQNVVVIIAGHGSNIQQARQQAQRFGFPIYAFPNEKSLEAWRLK
ncbi:MAG: DUF58 domain-containing protein [Anaerolineales bacterium]